MDVIDRMIRVTSYIAVVYMKTVNNTNNNGHDKFNFSCDDGGRGQEL